jgi:hypothetical protein
MLTITPELALAMEAGTLARWKQEIAARIAHDFPQAAPDDETLQDWVRDAMETIRRAGATSRSDIELYAHALFRVTEASDHPIALQDFVTIMTLPGDYSLRIKTLRKAFPL